MERKTFNTLIKADHKLGRCDYVIGRIDGIMYILCEKESDERYTIMANDEIGHRLTVNCTEEQYEEFVKVTEKLYPGLCEFYSKIVI